MKTTYKNGEVMMIEYTQEEIQERLKNHPMLKCFPSNTYIITFVIIGLILHWLGVL